MPKQEQTEPMPKKKPKRNRVHEEATEIPPEKAQTREEAPLKAKDTEKSSQDTVSLKDLQKNVWPRYDSVAEGGTKEPGFGADESKAAYKKIQDLIKPTPETPQAQFTDALNAFFKPYTDEMKSLPGQYQDVLTQLGKQGAGDIGPSPVPSYTGPNAAAINQSAQGLSSAENAYTAALTAGSKGVQDAAAGLAPSVANMTAGMPYADVLSTILTSQKNQLLYGKPSNPMGVNIGAWPEALQNVYSYLHGTASGTAPLTGGGTDTIPTGLGGGTSATGGTGQSLNPAIASGAQPYAGGTIPTGPSSSLTQNG